MTWAVLIDDTVSTVNLVNLLRRKAECGADLHLDSRLIQAGDVFVACPGITGDGRHYVQQAIKRGASAVLIHVGHTESWTAMDLRVPAFGVVGLQARLGELGDIWYESPSGSLHVVAITGTNGKTSCAYWLADALGRLGKKAGVIGTLGIRFPDGKNQAGTLTTPDVLSVHRVLAALLRAEAQVVAIEASSIGLAQGRLSGVRIQDAAFTNLSRDHLDYHASMAEYEAAKAALFAWPDLKSRHLNVDDAAGQRIAASLTQPFNGFGLTQSTNAADVVAQDIVLTPSGVSFTLVHGASTVALKSQLFGLHNVSNLLCVASILISMGFELAKIASVLSVLEPVEGRLQKVAAVRSGSELPTIVVDYAHTPDALQRALEALRPLATKQNGKLWCVFGCGGHRDAGKRPMMGAIAMRLADQVVVTSDNPRDEVPEAIIAQIVDPLPQGITHVAIEPDRAQAILRAVLGAQNKDVVLIAGKGHEAYQEINGTRTAFDDRQWSRLALLLKGGLDLQSDSRKIGSGAVFIALSGETFDGHDYLAQVQESGAIAAIVNQIDPAIGLPQIAVGNTRQALLQIGKAWRRQFDIPVIAVTGSNGKTTTKEMIASILAAWLGESRRLATAGNLNNELGVPFTLLRLSAQHRAAVIELGMNHPGEIAVLADTAAPTVALVNNAQREHQEFMVSVHAVAQENGQVLLNLPEAGIGIYPANDPYTELWDQMSGAHKHLHFGFNQQAQIWPSNIEADALGTSFLMHTPAGEHRVTLSVPGMHNLSNALAAAACGLAAGAPLSAVAKGLSDFHAVAGRMQPHRMAGGVVMIDDTYNANPDSVRAAIDVLASLTGPRVLVLGDMGEVGDNGPAMHFEVGAYAREKGIEILLTLGQATQESARAFGQGAVICESADRIARELKNLTAKSVLIKGSRFMRMERIAREYLEQFSVVPGDLVNHAV